MPSSLGLGQAGSSVKSSKPTRGHDTSQTYMIGSEVIELSSSSDSDSEDHRSDHPSQLGESTSLFSDQSSPLTPTRKVHSQHNGPQRPQGTASNPISCTSSPLVGSPDSRSSELVQRTRTQGVDFSSPIGRNSSNPFLYLANRRKKMVVEREPPKSSTGDTQKPANGFAKESNRVAGGPQFGKPSSLNNPWKPVNVFNQPKPNQPRPEHHRPTVQATSHVYPTKNPPATIYPLQYRNDNGNAKVLEPSRPMAKPSNPPVYPTHAVPPPTLTARPPSHSFVPTYSSYGQQVVDLTSSRPAGPIYGGEAFVYNDPSTYLKSDEANKSIKALLEGSLEDDEDKPRTRGRRKKIQQSIESLSAELGSLDVKAEDTSKESEVAEEEEEEEEDDGTVEGLKVKLLPHQIVGLDWLQDREAGEKKGRAAPKGGILADDMGLGKTIQSVALILTHPRPPITAIKDKQSLPSEVGKGTLVVAPLALIKQWEAEIKDKVHDSHALRVCVHHGPGRTKRFEDLKKYDVVITTYQILVSEHGSSSPRLDGPQSGCFGIHWYRIILDEAHSIKNRQAKATKAAYALRSEYRWCLTGTPMQNNLDELQSLIQFLRIKPYCEISSWKEQITGPMNRGLGGLAVKRLNAVLKTFMKRRTKDVLKKEGALNPGGKMDAKNPSIKGFQIMERNVRTIEVEFSEGERAFYNRLEQRTDKSLSHLMNQAKLNYASALVLLLRLRQACNHPDLIKGELAEEKEALMTGMGLGSQSPRKGSGSGGLDALAGLIGGLSVEAKQCKQCLEDLSSEEVADGMTRCTQCKELNCQGPITSLRRGKQVVNSDDEGPGDWLSEDRPSGADLGVAGGSDDENAEGSGDTLGSIDTDSDSDAGSDEDSDVQITAIRRRKAITIPDSTEQSPASVKHEPKPKQSKHRLNPKDPIISAKIRHLVDILDREAPKQKIIVFSVFTSMLNLIEPHLRNADHTYTRYDGSMRNDAREAALERLRKDKHCRILLCSLKCGSLGLNLTAASCVVIMEPFWNPFVEEQAIDRVHRINQTRDVVVYKMTVRDTVEARIIALQERKRALAEATIEGKSEASKLSMKELMGLFDHKAESDERHRDEGFGKKIGLLAGGGDEEYKSTRADSSTFDVKLVPRPKDIHARGKEHEVYGRRW